MDETIYWTQIGAIGQIAGSIATFIAVAVSLWIVLSERKENIRLSVGERLIVPGDLNGPLSVISFNVINMGLIPVRITSFGWQIGWLRRGPSFLKVRYAIQTGGQGLPGQEPPFDLLPGHSQSFLIDRKNFYENLNKNDFFGFRSSKHFRPIYPKVCGSVHTARGTTVVVTVEQTLKNSLKGKVVRPS